MLQIQLPELNRYYKLQSRMHDVMESVLNSCLEPTNEMILNLIEIETSLINTNHPDFIGSADSLLNLFAEEPKEAQSESEEETTDQQFSFINKQKNLNESQQQELSGLKKSQSEPNAEETKQEAGKKGWMPSFFAKKQKEESKEEGDNQLTPFEEAKEGGLIPAPQLATMYSYD